MQAKRQTISPATCQDLETDPVRLNEDRSQAVRVNAVQLVLRRHRYALRRANRHRLCAYQGVYVKR